MGIGRMNEHGSSTDTKFVEKIKEISNDEKGIAFLKGFLELNGIYNF